MKGLRYEFVAFCSVLALAFVITFAAADVSPPSPAVVDTAFRSDLRRWLSLDGEWDFALDPKDIGESERWFSRGKPFEMRIRVPGAWEAEGVGEPGLSHPTP